MTAFPTAPRPVSRGATWTRTALLAEQGLNPVPKDPLEAACLERGPLCSGRGRADVPRAGVVAASGALSPDRAPCPRRTPRGPRTGEAAPQSLTFALSPSGDGDIVNNMHEPDPDLLAGESAEYETEDSVVSPIPMGPPSPFPTSEDFTPKEGSPYEAPVYIPEDIPIPPDFELRESSIPGAGLGVWARKRMEVGERFGPYMAAPRATPKEADFGWEVSIPV